ncbi:MAG: non-homologous end-joining DNA ligase [Anaerolineales bacterium]
MSEEQEIKIGGQTVQLSSLDKMLFPGIGLTKGEMIDYYRRIGEIMVPHMRRRPITMQQFPKGIDAGGFYRKEVPDHFPDWLDRVEVPVEEEGGEEQPQVVCNDVATLVYLANQNCVTFHVWLSRAGKLDYPDKLIFDLDPPTEAFEPIRRAAFDLRDLMEEVGLVPYVMTTGSRGLHVVAPLDRSADFDTVRAVARAMAQVLVDRQPDRLTLEMSKAERGDRVFLDYLRNSYAQHGVAPYSLRPKPGAPIATPLDWEELRDKEIKSQSYTVDNIFRRLGQKADPWRDFYDDACSIETAREKLYALYDNDE